MINFNGTKLKEKRLMKKVEKAVFLRLNQPNFFVTDIAVVDCDTIQEFNRENRGVDKVTDVLSFPYFEGLKLPKAEEDFCDSDFHKGKVALGSIMICRHRAIEQAQEYGHSIEREMGFLTCHGLLHLLGYDHVIEEDKKIMRALEEAVLKKYKITRDF